MIEPLARGVDPVQLAFQSLVSMGTRAQRTESPLAVALDQLGVDLARGQSFTTPEAKQFVGLVQATLEVFAAAVPAEQPTEGSGAVPPTAAPAEGTGALLETAQVAMRDLQRALTQVLTEHRQVTTSLAPILRQLFVAMQTDTPDARPPVLLPLREYAGRVVDVQAPPPTLAKLVSSLVESIARLQAVLPADALARAEGLAAPEHAAAAGGAAPMTAAVVLPAGTVRLLQTLVAALADLATLLPPAEHALPVGHPSATLPGTTAQALLDLARALGEALGQLHEVLRATSEPATFEPPTSGPSSSRPAPNAAATSGPAMSASATSAATTAGLATSGPATSAPAMPGSAPSGPATSAPAMPGSATAALLAAALATAALAMPAFPTAALPTGAALATAAPGPGAQSHPANEAARLPAPPQSGPPPSPGRLGNAVAQVIRLVHELLMPDPAALADVAATEPPSPLASRSLAGSQAEAARSPVAGPADAAAALTLSRATRPPAPRPVDLPDSVGVGAAPIPASLVAGLMQVVATLKAGLLPGASGADASDAAALETATLLAELEASAALSPGVPMPAVPTSSLATVDAYRWGLLVGLNYRPVLGRPAQPRLDSSRPRCATCSRLLVQTRSGALVCPTC